MRDGVGSRSQSDLMLREFLERGNSCRPMIFKFSNGRIPVNVRLWQSQEYWLTVTVC